MSILLSVLLCSLTVVAQRNSQSESICAPFLTGKFTTPLNPKLKRNFSYDENAEFECELVLQDVNLPAQIRVTIHEGLSYLAVRHVQGGLKRHKDVYRHLNILADMLPSNHGFSYRAGYWALDMFVLEAEAAIKHLVNSLHGTASTESGLSISDIYSTRREIVRAYNRMGRHSDAINELKDSLETYRLDFGAAFVLSDSLLAHHQPDQNLDEGLDSSLDYDASVLLETVQSAYDLVSSCLQNDYSGFQIPYPTRSHDRGNGVPQKTYWQPTRLNKLPSHNEFMTYVNDRQPFVLTSDATANFTAFGWTNIVKKWNQAKMQKTGEKIKQEAQKNLEKWQFEERTTYETSDGAASSDVRVECANIPKRMSASDSTFFGFGVGTYKKSMSFQDYIEQEYMMPTGGANSSSGTNRRCYLNVQNEGGRNVQDVSKYRMPLTHLLSDISPEPAFFHRSDKELSESVPVVGELNIDGENAAGLSNDKPKNEQDNNKDLWDSLTDVNLWMGNTMPRGPDFSTAEKIETVRHETGHKVTTSRPHVDALDNLYMVVKGQKHFSIASPDQAPAMQTMFPTVAIAPNGVSFRSCWKDFDLSKNDTQTLISSVIVEGTFDDDGELVIEKSSEWAKGPPAREEEDVTNSHFADTLFHKPISLLEQDDSDEFDEFDDMDEDNELLLSHFDLGPGEALFLPAGWFHQVSSFGGYPSQGKTHSTGQHIALNYWWKPPGWDSTSGLRYEQQAKQKVADELLHLKAVEIERERVRSAAAAVRAVEEAQAQRRTKLAEEIAAQRMKMDSRYLDEVLYDDYYDAEFEEDVVEIVF